MSGKKGIWLLLALSVVILVVGSTLQLNGVAQARPPAQQPQPAGLTIPYPGRLTDKTGAAVADGAYDLTFSLYDTSDGGTLLWSEVQEGVTVTGGTFVTSLGLVNPIPADLMTGGERWLEVAVRGPGEAEFTALLPRQHIGAAGPTPNAGINAPACPHDHWGEAWSGTGVGLALTDTATNNYVAIPGALVAVLGSADLWVGVWGKSNTNIGVLGSSTDYRGVMGESTNGYGGWFQSGGDHLDIGLGGAVGRVNANEQANSELYLSANGDVTLKLDNDSGGDNRLNVRNSAGTAVCTVDEGGSLTCTGSKSAVVETADYGWRKLYAVESPEVWHEDLGTAALQAGEATVTFDPVFAQTVNLQEEYHVFVTPLSQEPVLLYVSEKTTDGFTVQGVTLDGRPATCSFDYRVVAKRLGYENVRLEPPAYPVEGGE